MGNLKWKLALCVIGLAVVLGATFMASDMTFTTPPVSAAGTCTVTVDLPDGAPVGAKVSIYPWNSSYTDGQSFVGNQGAIVTWRLIVGQFTGNTFNYTIPASEAAILTVGPSAYCKMKVINVPDGGKINVYPWNTNWYNNDEIFVPIGSSCKWKLIVNGFSGNEYTKNFDCTALDAKQAWMYVGNSFCNMKVQMDDAAAAAGYLVSVYPWNTNWVDDQVIVVPLGGSCKWRLAGNGFTGKEFIKNFDCTPLVVNGGAYCNMKVTGVPDGQKVNVYPWNTYWTNGQVIVVPIGGSCKWKLTGPGAPATEYTKNFDCTDLNAGP